MILEEETFEEFGYLPSKLSQQSNKKVVVQCDYCEIKFTKFKSAIYIQNKKFNKDACKNCIRKRNKDIRDVKSKNNGTKIKYGDKFFRLKFIKETNIGNRGQNALFLCECGNEIETRIADVKYGSVKSCGCLFKETRNGNKSHGLYLTKEYKLYLRIKSKYKLDESWDTVEKFYESIKNQLKDGFSITTIDSNKPLGINNFKLIETEKLIRINHEKSCIKNLGVKSPLASKKVWDKINNTLIKKYKTTNINRIDSVKKKRKERSINKWGVDHPNKHPDNIKKIKEGQIRNGLVKLYNGKYLYEIGIEKGYSKNTFCQIVKQYGFDIAINKKKGLTSLESAVENILNEIGVNYEKQKRIDTKFSDFKVNNILIEADGIYWHSTAKVRDKYQDRNKYLVYKKLGYDSLFFREDEIVEKAEIVKSIIKRKLNKLPSVIENNIVHTDNNESKEFFNINHILGHSSGRTVSIYTDKIVSAIQYRIHKDKIIIKRFCDELNYNVENSFNILLNYILNLHNINKVEITIDNRFGIHSYVKNFKLIKEYVDFKYTKRDKTIHRKDNKDKTLHRIYDCGQSVYQMIKAS